MNALRDFHTGAEPPCDGQPCEQWLSYLTSYKVLLGNLSNDVSAVACLLAKAYLEARHDLPPFEILSKPQGAAGHDVDVRTTGGERIVGEVKTTIPYNGPDFGASQDKEVRKDFDKLAAARADFKYFFVTDQRAFAAIKHKFLPFSAGVILVKLPEGEMETHSGPVSYAS